MNYKNVLTNPSTLKRTAFKSIINNLILNQSKLISTSSTLNARSSGRYKPTRDGSLPLTYEQSFKPERIGVNKSWTSFNSANLYEGMRRGDTLVEDILMRKIVNGFWPTLVMGDVVIKRRGNMIFLAFFISKNVRAQKAYFLVGFTEQILSYLLKCPVKLEIQTGNSMRSMYVKYI